MLDVTEAFLETEIEDIDVTTETSPKSAVSTVTESVFDCIISDYEMPAMDGLEFYERVRAEGVDIPFILYTGKGSEEIASKALNTGVTGYFQKGGPDQLRRLANRVEQAAHEHQTQKEADRYSTVLEALEYPIYVVNEDGEFEFVNEPFAELTGYETETIIGNPPELIKTDRGVELAERELGRILSSSGPDTSQFEIEIVPKDGEPVLCRDHMAALPYEGDSFRGSVGILREISQERERQRELAMKTRAIDEAPVGIVMSDPKQEDNPMVYVNDEFVSLTGYPREESQGQNCRFLQGPDTDEERVAALREAIEEGREETVTLRNYRRDGEPFWNRVTVAPLCSEDGEVVRWVGFQEDVTERKEYREQLERQNARVEKLASALSHDLKNPLQIAQTRLELARTDPEKHLDKIGAAHRRMEELIGDLLAMIRSDATDIETAAIDLGEVAHRCWGHIDSPAATLNVEVEGRIVADSRRLRQILENLFDNAVTHGGEDVTVTVGSLRDGFYVADNGEGIPPDQRESVFELGHSGTTDGTGFGLNIVEEFAAAHGWQVEVTESDSGGARFEITGVSFE